MLPMFFLAFPITGPSSANSRTREDLYRASQNMPSFLDFFYNQTVKDFRRLLWFGQLAKSQEYTFHSHPFPFGEDPLSPPFFPSRARCTFRWEGLLPRDVKEMRSSLVFSHSIEILFFLRSDILLFSPAWVASLAVRFPINTVSRLRIDGCRKA